MKTTRRSGAWAFATFALFLSSLQPGDATTVSWTNTAGGNWSVAANWSGGALPTAADDVLITAAGSYSVTQDVHVTVTSLTLGGASGRQTLTNAGANLTLNGASAVNSNGVFGFANGTLAGAGLLTANGRCIWGAGTWAGRVLISAGGELDLAGNVDKVLSGNVTNRGTITWNGANHLYLANGHIYNLAGGLFEIQNNQNILVSSGAPTVNNAGTIRKSSGGGVSTVAVPLINSGMLEVQSGDVSYWGGSQFNTGTAFTGTGTNAVYTGTVTFSGDVIAENLLIASDGTLNLAGTHTLSGMARWIGGTISGDMTIASNGTLNITGTADHGLSGSLNNRGVILWSDANTIYLGNGHFNNLAGGVFEMQNNQNILVSSGAPTVNNAGTIRKSSGGGASVIAVPLINSGTLEVQSGTLAYWGGSQFNTGTAFAGAGTNLVYTGTVTFNGALTSGNLEIASDGTLNLAGAHTLSGMVRWIGGTISGDMTIASNGTLNITGTADHGLSGSLNNRGVILWSGANTIYLGNGHLNNLAGGVFEMQNNQNILVSSGAPTVNNAGTIRKSSGGGVSVITAPLINSGTLDVWSGTLAYWGGSQFNTGTAFAGAGTNVIYTGLVTFNGTLTSENLEIASDSTLNLAGTHTLKGTVRWTGGTVSGTMTIATNGALNISGNADHALSGSLNNLGLAIWSGPNTIHMLNAPITNGVGAVFEIRNNQVLNLYNGAPKFHNHGTIRKSAGGGDTVITIPVVNAGLLEVQSGRIAFGTGSQFNTGTVFAGAGTNFVYTGTVTFNGTILSENLEIASDSTLVFGGNCTFSGVVNWTGGALADGGAFTIATNGVLRILGTSDRSVMGSLTNLGVITWSGLHNMDARLSARIVNESGALFEIQNNQWLSIYNGAPRVINNGTIRKSSGGGDTVITVPMINAGTLEVLSGRIAYGAGCQFNAGTSFTGAGTNLVYTGSATFNGIVDSANLELGGASVLGTNTLTGTVRWTAGEIGEPARVTVASNCTLHITTTADHAIRDVLSNAGRILWSGANTIYFIHTGTISNLAGGVFDAEADGVLAQYSGVSTFRNQGVLRKSAGAGATTINLSTFQNTGTVDAQSGTIVFGNYSQTGGRLQFGLSSVTNFGQVRFAQSVALTGTLAANLLGGFRPRAGDAFAVISYFPSYTGAFAGFELPTEAAWQTNSSIYSANAVTLTVLNGRPSIDPVMDRTIDEQVLSSFMIVGSDPDSGQTLSYSLVNPPENAGINASSGLFTWTPSEAQGPSTNAISVRATDNGSPALNTTNTFTIVVREVNRRPIPATLGPFSASELTPFSLSAPLATDPDVPANTLHFELLDAPHGMVINPDTGAIAWTPTEAQGPSVNTIAVRIADNGSPALSATNTFVIQVAEANVAPVLLAASDQIVVPGGTLLVTNRASDTDLPANLLTFSLLEHPSQASIEPGTGLLTWKTGSADAGTTNRFTVVVRDNGVPILSATQSFQAIVLPLPRLSIARVDTAVQLSWPTLYSGYVLEAATNLNLPTGWSVLTNEVSLADTNHVVTDFPAALHRHYRLTHP